MVWIWSRIKSRFGADLAEMLAYLSALYVRCQRMTVHHAYRLLNWLQMRLQEAGNEAAVLAVPDLRVSQSEWRCDGATCTKYPSCAAGLLRILRTAGRYSRSAEILTTPEDAAW